jgi:large subunit ribosomal protein L24
MATRKQPLVLGGEVKLHVKAGDTIEVIAGNDKGQTGVVLEAYPREQRLLVQGVNKRWRHRKPTQQNPKGERIQEERPIHVSNVKLVASGASKKRGA